MIDASGDAEARIIRGFKMNPEERQGTVERLTQKGVFLSGTWYGFSKYLRGESLNEAHVGCPVTVLVHEYKDKLYIDCVKAIGEKDPAFVPPERPQQGASAGWNGGYRKLSPEELELKRDEGVRIARSVAVDRAITMAKEGIPIEKVASLARTVEEYLLKGVLPSAPAPKKEAPAKDAPEPPPAQSPAQRSTHARPESPRPPAPEKAATPTPDAKPKRLPARIVSGLFNEALRGGLVEDWHDFLARIEDILKVKTRNPYHLSVGDFAKVEAVIRSKLGRNTAA